MALHDEILREIILGRVPRRFKPSDLKQVLGATPHRYRLGGAEYAESTINTVPRNHSIRPDGSGAGDYVRKGKTPAFWWYGANEFELILDRQHIVKGVDPEVEEGDVDEGEGEALILRRSPDTKIKRASQEVYSGLVSRIVQEEHTPAATIVRYIADRSFRAYQRRQLLGEIRRGWGERLAAYHWPRPAQTWQLTCRRVGDFSARIREAIGKLSFHEDDYVAAEELLNAFKDVCVWGGVRLPESDARALAAEVLRTFRILSGAGEPGPNCRLNSA